MIKRCVLVFGLHILYAEETDSVPNTLKEEPMMALNNLASWNAQIASSACGAACGAGDKPAQEEEKKPAACGAACGAADKPAEEKKPAVCGAACGASDK